MKTIKHFRFHSQKVLPLVYDESLSYYEVLCKVISRLNDLTDMITNKLGELVKEHINKFFAEVLYDEETKCISFALVETEDENE